MKIATIQFNKDLKDVPNLPDLQMFLTVKLTQLNSLDEMPKDVRTILDNDVKQFGAFTVNITEEEHSPNLTLGHAFVDRLKGVQ